MFSGCYNEISENSNDSYVCIYKNEVFHQISYDGYSFNKKWFPLSKATKKVKAYYGKEELYSEQDLSAFYLFEDTSLNMFIAKKSIFGTDLYCSNKNILPKIEKNEIEYIIITPDERTDYQSKRCKQISDKEVLEQIQTEFVLADKFINKDKNKTYDYSNSITNGALSENEKCIYIKYKNFNALNLFGYLKEYEENRYTLFLYQAINSQEDNYLNWKLNEQCCAFMTTEK